MKRFFAFVMAVVATMFLVSCGGKGSSAPAPTGVTVVPGDTNVTVSWNAQPGVEYWIFDAAGNNVTPENCHTIPQCTTSISLYSSPTVVNARAIQENNIPLTNGTTYSFSINARTGGGPGGPGSASISVIPRLAGATWSVGTPASGIIGTPASGTQDLHGVAYGVVASGIYYFVAVGANGALFSSTDGISWTALANPVPGVNLNAVSYYGGKFVAVGNGGVILLSTDAATWTSYSTGTSNLYAISNFGVAGFAAAGASGTILTSSDGITWTPRTSNTTNPLYGITYGYNKYVAVGATSGGAGTLLTSTDGITWVPYSLPSLAYDLKGVAYGLPAVAYGYVTTAPTIGIFVASGANGTLLTSLDGGLNWTIQTAISGNPPINAVTFGHQFIAVDNVGSIYTSTDGISWPQAQSSVSPLYSVIPAQIGSGQLTGLYVYSVVGASGVNMQAQ